MSDNIKGNTGLILAGGGAIALYMYMKSRGIRASNEFIEYLEDIKTEMRSKQMPIPFLYHITFEPYRLMALQSTRVVNMALKDGVRGISTLVGYGALIGKMLPSGTAQSIPYAVPHIMKFNVAFGAVDYTKELIWGDATNETGYEYIYRLSATAGGLASGFLAVDGLIREQSKIKGIWRGLIGTISLMEINPFDMGQQLRSIGITNTAVNNLILYLTTTTPVNMARLDLLESFRFFRSDRSYNRRGNELTILLYFLKHIAIWLPQAIQNTSPYTKTGVLVGMSAFANSYLGVVDGVINRLVDLRDKVNGEFVLQNMPFMLWSTLNEMSMALLSLWLTIPKEEDIIIPATGTAVAPASIKDDWMIIDSAQMVIAFIIETLGFHMMEITDNMDSYENEKEFVDLFITPNNLTDVYDEIKQNNTLPAGEDDDSNEPQENEDPVNPPVVPSPERPPSGPKGPTHPTHPTEEPAENENPDPEPPIVSRPKQPRPDLMVELTNSNARKYINDINDLLQQKPSALYGRVSDDQGRSFVEIISAYLNPGEKWFIKQLAQSNPPNVLEFFKSFDTLNDSKWKSALKQIITYVNAQYNTSVFENNSGTNFRFLQVTQQFQPADGIILMYNVAEVMKMRPHPFIPKFKGAPGIVQILDFDHFVAQVEKAVAPKI